MSATTSTEKKTATGRQIVDMLEEGASITVRVGAHEFPLALIGGIPRLSSGNGGSWFAFAIVGVDAEQARIQLGYSELCEIVD